jgi:hypothetical protein
LNIIVLKISEICPVAIPVSEDIYYTD